MEDDFAYPKSNLKSTRNSKGRGSQGRSKFHRERKESGRNLPIIRKKNSLKKINRKLKLVARNVILTDQLITLLRCVLSLATLALT